MSFMKCGCSSSGCSSQGKPCCPLHGTLEAVEPPDLTNRQAKCAYGKHAIQPSNISLAFFRYFPNQEFDEYFCGCVGWD